MTEIFTDTWADGEPIRTGKLAYMSANDRLYYDKLSEKPRGIIFFKALLGSDTVDAQFKFRETGWQIFTVDDLNGNVLVGPALLDLTASRYYMIEVYMNNIRQTNDPLTTAAHTAEIRIFLNRVQVQSARGVNTSYLTAHGLTSVPRSTNQAGTVQAFYVFQTETVVTNPFELFIYGKSGGTGSEWIFDPLSYYAVHDMGAVSKTDLGV